MRHPLGTRGRHPKAGAAVSDLRDDIRAAIDMEAHCHENGYCLTPEILETTTDAVMAVIRARGVVTDEPKTCI